MAESAELAIWDLEVRLQVSPMQSLDSDLNEFQKLVEGGYPEAGAKQFSFYSRVTCVLQAYARDIAVDNYTRNPDSKKKPK